ncbi:MAG TPA: nitroreductase family deazaflavin-dependent oxidoreductase [Chloroflexia bacterium]|nr:nitroreductase family deazaflavin-dependent oxidoreductase [Chloroflexia bacterium]
MADLQDLAAQDFCYLTTTGRRTGKAHTIEIWFALATGVSTLHLLAGGGYDADWVRNIQQNPQVSVRIGTTLFAGGGRVVEDAAEEMQARHGVVKKYYGRDVVETSGWEATALPVALDLVLPGAPL